MGRAVRRRGDEMMADSIELDEIDRAIIRQLQVDGRTPYSKLGPAVGLSQAAVRPRVQRLIDRGAMQVVAITDPSTLGFTIQAMIGIRAEGSVKTVGDTLGEIDEVEYVVITAGRYDILAEVVCFDTHALFDLVNDRIRALPGVAATEIFTYLGVLKRSYSWEQEP